ncbi:zinc finger protein 490-like [Macrosteles quadrilineatus]|uniref:zinc finger protein 490-like n=1 Tax=Macrosteles quadrilineatus TaxID=74068 RepID=UPI0023E09226|nr:zinc finger protein 490-like [Macrosteles quadrilineatus]
MAPSDLYSPFDRKGLKMRTPTNKDEPGRAKTFVCNRCGRQYVYQTSLRKHQRQECGVEPMFRCVVESEAKGISQACKTCGKVYKRAGCLKSHQDDCVVVYCQKCLVRFTSLKEVRTHEVVCKGSTEPIHVCYVCHMKFKSMKHLKRHVSIECGKPDISCSFCKFKTKLQHKYMKHMWKKHPKGFEGLPDKDERENVPIQVHPPSRDVDKKRRSPLFAGEGFPCDKCPKVYKHKRSLWLHKRYECGIEAQFSCQHCDYTAKQKTNFPIEFPREEPPPTPQSERSFYLEKKQRKPRTAFTKLQIMELERRFERDHYLTPGDRASLAASLGLDTTQVLLWFQNRRAKLKRDLEEMKAKGKTAEGARWK